MIENDKIIESDNKIQSYFHCGLCVKESLEIISKKEFKKGQSPRDFVQLEIGWTKIGIQIWCKKHDCNVIHLDFEGHQHPANINRKK